MEKNLGLRANNLNLTVVLKIPAATIGARAIPVGKMVRDDKGYYNLYEAISYSIFST